MVKKIVWSNKMSREDKKAVRDFLKDYDCDDLTVVFADRYAYQTKRGKEYSITRINGRARCGIAMFPRRNGCGYSITMDGEVIRRPAIIVNMNIEGKKRCWTWQTTFLHEVGHYIDWKTDPEGFRRKSSKAKERFAREFSALKTL